MLTTLLRPTAGTATVNGFDVLTQPVQVRRSIGYVSQAGSTFSQALAGDEVSDHGQLYGMSRRDAVSRGKRLFEELQLDGLWDRMPKNMSGGQKRRLDIVMGLIHDPSLVFLTTHYLDEADALSDRIVIIDNGRIVAADTPEHLKSQVSGDLVRLEFADVAHVPAVAQALDGVGSDVAVDGPAVSARVRGSARIVPGLLRDLESRGVVLDSLEIVKPTLDDVFLTLTGRSLRDETSTPDPQTEKEAAR